MIRPVAWRGSAVLIAVFLSLGTGALVGVAMSQEPTPSSGKSEGRPPQPSPNGPQSEAQKNTSPATANAAAIAEHSQDGKQRESTPDWWMVTLTGLLVVVGGLQVWSVISQNNIMK